MKECPPREIGTSGQGLLVSIERLLATSCCLQYIMACWWRMQLVAWLYSSTCFFPTFLVFAIGDAFQLRTFHFFLFSAAVEHRDFVYRHHQATCSVSLLVACWLLFCRKEEEESCDRTASQMPLVGVAHGLDDAMAAVRRRTYLSYLLLCFSANVQT